MSKPQRRQIKFKCDWHECGKLSEEWESDPSEYFIQSNVVYQGEETDWVKDERAALPKGWLLVVFDEMPGTLAGTFASATLGHFCCDEHRDARVAEQKKIAEEALTDE